MVDRRLRFLRLPLHGLKGPEGLSLPKEHVLVESDGYLERGSPRCQHDAADRVVRDLVADSHRPRRFGIGAERLVRQDHAHALKNLAGLVERDMPVILVAEPGPCINVQICPQGFGGERSAEIRTALPPPSFG